MMAQLGRQATMPLRDLLAGFSRGVVAQTPLVTGISLDSRRIRPGWLFLACRGESRHGLAFADDVRRAGAVAIAAEPDAGWDDAEMTRLARALRLPVIPVPDLRRRASALADRFFGEPSASLSVIGVTGTNGKTSVTHFLAQALESDVACAVIGTLGMGFPGDLSSTSHTTPDPVSLQSALAWLRERGAGAVAMEVSSHALEQGRTDAVRFSHAVFTNLSRDHLDYHGDMAAYGAAKRLLFRVQGLEWAVLNLDDALSVTIQRDLEPDVSLGCYSLAPNAPIPKRCRIWVRASVVTPGPEGLTLEIDSNLGSGSVDVGLIGRFNAANLLAVLTVLLSKGMHFDRALRALAGIRGVPGRMERFGGRGLPLIVVDYAHTPDALEKALISLREHCAGRLLCVFGCGGERDVGKRPLMGAVAERLSDGVMLTDDNPRGDDGDAIIEEILAGMSDPGNGRVERQRALAIRRAVAAAGVGDLVLVAGKGHETLQDLGDLKIHFSDRAQVQQVLAELSRQSNPEPERGR